MPANGSLRCRGVTGRRHLHCGDAPVERHDGAGQEIRLSAKDRAGGVRLIVPGPGRNSPGFFAPRQGDCGQTPQARSMYLPVRVSIFSFSPVLMNSGAWTTMPVSIVTGFCTLLAESPRMPSGASVTVNTTLDGNSMETALSSTNVI